MATAWYEEFERFLVHIHEWCNRHADKITGAFLDRSDEGLKVFLVTPGAEYRFDLDDAAADLDAELGDLFEHCPANVIHLPMALAEERSFFTRNPS